MLRVIAETFKVDLRGFSTVTGIHHTMASSKRKAFTNILIRLVGIQGMKDIFNSIVREEGEEGLHFIIEKSVVPLEPEQVATPMPSEETPAPPPAQLEFWQRVQAFQKVTDSQHPIAKAVGLWKDQHRMKFVTKDQLIDIMGPQTATISIKMDGELVAIYYDNGKAETVTNRGTIRTGFPAIDEVAQILKDHKKAAFMGELYAVDESGQPQSYMKAATIVRNPDSGKDNLLRLGVFDIIEIDDKDLTTETIENKVKIINQIFKDGKFVHPAPTVEGDAKKVEELWEQAESQGWEGLVVHYGGMMYKVKPIMSYDMVIVAVTKSPKFVEQIGAVLCAFMDKEGKFRLNGTVGGGFTDEEKARLLEWAERNKVREDEEKIWVDPFKEPLIVEVEAMEVNIKKRPKMEYKDKKWVQIEDDWSGILRFPHAKRFREDKSPKPQDVSIDQLPLKQEGAAQIENKPYVMYSDGLTVGMTVQVITGYIGKIIGLMPKSGDGGGDLDLLIQWDDPILGCIYVSEIHPTEVLRIWK